MQPRMKNPAMIVNDAMARLMALGKMLAGSPIPVKTLGLVHLRASQINNCSTCVDMEITKTTDTPQRLGAVAVWREAPFFTDAERAALGRALPVRKAASRPEARVTFSWGYHGWGPYTRQLVEPVDIVEAERGLHRRLRKYVEPRHRDEAAIARGQ
jgi:AhpD family alkylhydroperoxidase